MIDQSGPVHRERDRESEIHQVHSASLAYEDGSVFMSEQVHWETTGHPIDA